MCLQRNKKDHEEEVGDNLGRGQQEEGERGGEGVGEGVGEGEGEGVILPLDLHLQVEVTTILIPQGDSLDCI